jgi:hypothetical protein
MEQHFSKTRIRIFICGRCVVAYPKKYHKPNVPYLAKAVEIVARAGLQV